LTPGPPTSLLSSRRGPCKNGERGTPLFRIREFIEMAGAWMRNLVLDRNSTWKASSGMTRSDDKFSGTLSRDGKHLELVTRAELN